MTSAALIEEVSKVVSNITGVQLGKKQSAMVESRLTRRMLQLGLNRPEDYLRHLQEHRESEVTALVSLLTTHHTTFFREFSHFEYLEKTGLPHLVQSLRARNEKTLRVWSAACSRGHEVYSLAMFLSYHLQRLAPEMKFEIYGSDVDPKSVEVAKNGVYRWEDIKSIPSIYLANNWARGTGEIAEFVKAKTALRSPCQFGVVNLLDFQKEMANKAYDIIFCRNVFIYFTLEQIKKITESLLGHLTKDGLFFIGISESLNGTSLPLDYLAPSVYAHKKAPKVSPAVATPTLPHRPASGLEPVPALRAEPAQPIRVFAIDDSPTILGLLKKILTHDVGFEVVGTAENGADAAEKLRSLRVDVVTLDIHMPVQNGIEYLQRNLTGSHPPVVMVTSVSREDAQLGLRSLALGAVDYVEKPSLADLARRADEIRTKLRCAALLPRPRGGDASVLEIEKSFEKRYVIGAPEKKLRVVFAGVGDREKLVRVLRSFSGPQPATVLFLPEAGVLLEGLGSVIHAATGKKPKTLEWPMKELVPGEVYLAEMARLEEFRTSFSQRRTSCIVFSSLSGPALTKATSWPHAHVIAEDVNVTLSPDHKTLLAKAHRVIPYTSFAYHSDEFLSEDGEAKRRV